MKRITQKLFTAAIICALAGFVFCAVNQQQWTVIMEKDLQDPVIVSQSTNVSITRSYKDLGLGLFVLSGALMVTAGLVINRYGYPAAPAKPEQQTIVS